MRQLLKLLIRFVIQILNMYTEVVGGDDDDSHCGTLCRGCTGSVNIAVLTSLQLDKLKLAVMHSATACAIQIKSTCPHFVTSGLPTQNRIQQNFGVDDPCRTLVTGSIAPSPICTDGVHMCVSER